MSIDSNDYYKKNEKPKIIRTREKSHIERNGQKAINISKIHYMQTKETQTKLKQFSEYERTRTACCEFYL